MAEKVYNVSQLPSYADQNRMDWQSDDYNITVKRTEDNKMKLSGELLEWDEANEDWKGVEISRDECIDIIEREELVIPINGGIKSLSDIFKKK